MPFVVVVGDDPVSREQIRVCQAARPPEVTAALRCDDAENRDNAHCTSTPSFPIFCHTETGRCSGPGLRTSRDDFEQLAELSTHTKDRCPPPPPPRES